MADWHWLAPPSWEPLRRCGQLLLQDPTSGTRVLHTPSAPLCLQWVTETPEPFVCFPGNGLDKASSKFHSMYIYISLSLFVCVYLVMFCLPICAHAVSMKFNEMSVCSPIHHITYTYVCVTHRVLSPCFPCFLLKDFYLGTAFIHLTLIYVFIHIYICVCVYIYVDVLWFLRCCNFFIFPDMYGFLTFRSARSRVTARFGFYNYFGGNAIPFMVATYHGRVDWPKSCGQKSLTDHGFASVNYLASFALVGWWAQFGWATGG